MQVTGEESAQDRFAIVRHFNLRFNCHAKHKYLAPLLTASPVFACFIFSET